MWFSLVAVVIAMTPVVATVVIHTRWWLEKLGQSTLDGSWMSVEELITESDCSRVCSLRGMCGHFTFEESIYIYANSSY